MFKNLSVLLNILPLGFISHSNVFPFISAKLNKACNLGLTNLLPLIFISANNLNRCSIGLTICSLKEEAALLLAPIILLVSISNSLYKVLRLLSSNVLLVTSANTLTKSDNLLLPNTILNIV